MPHNLTSAALICEACHVYSIIEHIGQSEQFVASLIGRSKLIEELRLLQQAALADDHAYRQTAHLCSSIGPRLSGSPQAEQSVKYAAEEARRLGLEVRLERVMVPRWVRGEETAALVEFPG